MLKRPPVIWAAEDLPTFTYISNLLFPIQKKEAGTPKTKK